MNNVSKLEHRNSNSETNSRSRGLVACCAKLHGAIYINALIRLTMTSGDFYCRLTRVRSAGRRRDARFACACLREATVHANATGRQTPLVLCYASKLIFASGRRAYKYSKVGTFGRLSSDSLGRQLSFSPSVFTFRTFSLFSAPYTHRPTYGEWKAHKRDFAAATKGSSQQLPPSRSGN